MVYVGKSRSSERASRTRNVRCARCDDCRFIQSGSVSRDRDDQCRDDGIYGNRRGVRYELRSWRGRSNRYTGLDRTVKHEHDIFFDTDGEHCLYNGDACNSLRLCVDLQFDTKQQGVERPYVRESNHYGRHSHIDDAD